MKKSIVMLCGMAGVIGAGGCSRSHEVPELSGVKIMPAITRVSGLDFETGDEIGLTITRASGIYAENVRMSYDGTVFSASDLAWYDQTSDPATLTAYYPYAENGAPVRFSVAADQSSGIESSDLLSALKSNVTPTESAVGMVFRHLMASVRIVVTNRTASAVEELRLGGTVLSADVDLAAQTAKAGSGAPAAEIKAFAQVPNESYRAVVVPQTAALTLTARTADGKSRSASFEATELLQGKYYTVSLVDEQDRLVPTLSGDVADWETGGELKPDTDGNEGGDSPDDEPGGDDASGDTMVCMDETYATVELGGRIWMAENLRHVTGDPSGCWYPSDASSENLKKYGMLYDYETAQGLCPDGWRLPEEADFEALVAVLEEPYTDFIPLAGLYSKAAGKNNGFGVRGCLMGATEGESGMRKYLQINTLGGGVPVIQDSQVANGVSVRFVKDAQ